MRKIWAVLILLFLTSTAYGFEIVYPKSKNVTIASPTTFFIGSSKEPVTINGENIKLHPTGGFAYFVKLKSGVNEFTVKSSQKTEIYKITQKRNYYTNANSMFISYKTVKPLVVITQNTPLRSTPVDGGINRISHLQKGILLIADGEKGNFFRVKLNDSKYGWISKKNVSETTAYTPAKVKKYSFSETNSDYILTFELDKKVPFEINAGNSIELNFYNTENEKHYSFPYYEKTGSKKLWGYNGDYNGNIFTLKIRKPPVINRRKTLSGITVAVDAGHGGAEKGAIGCLGDKEKDVVLKIAKYLEKELKERGANVVMTRSDDVAVGLNERVEIVNKNDSIFFVSIHNNALPDTLNPNEHRGTSIYYYYNESKPFAQAMLDTLTEELGTKNDNLHQQSFVVVRNTLALSILIEIAYLINPDDNALLVSEEFQKKAAKAIADGIEKYIQNSV
ncbi:N-acetylmuramoyl-L-alanine amidase [bacterium]|nr:N-acetylmuramoyl-L-alanine amidase [bacterium]